MNAKYSHETVGDCVDTNSKACLFQRGCRRALCDLSRGSRAHPLADPVPRSEEHTSELQSLRHLVCRLLLEKKKNISNTPEENTNHQEPDTSERACGDSTGTQTYMCTL